MPIHDWSRVRAGRFQHFHNSWIYALADRLNDGLLPPDLFAAGEQKFPVTGDESDVLALSLSDLPPGPFAVEPLELSGGGLKSAKARPPAVAAVQRADGGYDRAEDQVTIRRVDGNRVVAVIELVSGGNKSSRDRFDRFLSKNGRYLLAGVHLLLVDLFPPNGLNPAGVHAALWERLTGAPPGPVGNGVPRPLTLVSYRAGGDPTAFVQPAAVGEELTDVPLFLTDDDYIDVPLRGTYAARVAAYPAPWREDLTP